MPRPKKVDANSNAPAKVNNSQKKTTSSTPKQPTANEMREWYEKNKSRLERYEDATSAITSLRDIQKSKTYTTISNYSKEDVKDYTIWLNGDPEAMDREEILRRIRPYLGEEARIKVEIVDEIPVLASGKRKYIENRCEKYQQHKGFCG